MARINSMLAGLAAAGLVFAQPASAAVRAGSPIGESESATEGPGAGMIVGLIGLVGVVFVIMALTDDYDPQDRPTSP